MCYDIPVAFPELDQHPLPPANVPTSPYMTGSQEDATCKCINISTCCLINTNIKNPYTYSKVS